MTLVSIIIIVIILDLADDRTAFITKYVSQLGMVTLITMRSEWCLQQFQVYSNPIVLFI